MKITEGDAGEQQEALFQLLRPTSFNEMESTFCTKSPFLARATKL